MLKLSTSSSAVAGMPRQDHWKPSEIYACETRGAKPLGNQNDMIFSPISVLARSSLLLCPCDISRSSTLRKQKTCLGSYAPVPTGSPVQNGEVSHIAMR